MHQRVDSLLSSGRSAEAEAMARQALVDRPEDPLMQVLLARALFRQERMGAAADIVTATVAANPEYAYAYRVKGMIHAATGFNLAADAALTRGLALDPYDPVMHLQRAQLDVGIAGGKPQALRHLAKGTRFTPDLSRAFNDLDAALMLAPELSDVHLGFAALFSVQGRDADATAAARRALELDPESARAHEVLGILAERQKDVRTASEHYVAAGRSDPTSTRPLERLRRFGCHGGGYPHHHRVHADTSRVQSVRNDDGQLNRVIFAAVVFVVGYLFYSYRKRVVARRELSPEARALLDVDRSNRSRWRFRR